MKLTIITGIVLFSANSLFGATQVTRCQMPNAEELKKCLEGRPDFIKKSNFFEKIAGKKLTPWEVFVAYQLAVQEYTKEAEKASRNASLRKIPLGDDISSLECCERSILVKIFKDCPGAVNQLIQVGAVKPLKI